jgi:hypothetical protein
MDDLSERRLGSGLVLQTAAAAEVQNTRVASMLLVKPSNPGDNAITIKKSSSAWGTPTEGAGGVAYGTGQVLELLSESAVDAAAKDDPNNPVLFRIDALGGLGTVSGAHLATGLRATGFPAPTLSLWVQPSSDAYGIVLDNPTGSTVPTASYLLVRDARSSPTYTSVEIRADGRLQSNKSLTAKGRLPADVPLVVRRIPGQTAPLTAWTDSSGADLARLYPSGGFWSKNSLNVSNDPPASTGYFAIAVTTVNPAQYGLLIRPGQTGQVGDLLLLTDSANVVLSRVNKGGYFMTRLHSEPADGDLATGELSMWFDQVAGATKVRFKAKDSTGQVMRASLAMSAVANA